MWSLFKYTDGMKNIAFIDLKFHKKTKSSIFFQDILGEHFNVNLFYEDERKKYIKESFAKYIFWQVIPDFLDLIKLKNKQIVFIPMYDGLALNKIVRERYKCFNIKIVCFCKKVYDFFAGMWFDCFYIQYYFPSLTYNVDYSKKKIFFWYRWNITWENVKTIIWDQKVEITIKNNPDPWYKALNISEDDIKKYQITFQNKFFDTKEDYFEMFSQHSIFIAPRRQEWIWMSFLESMSMWQCVVAYDDATMNEYIIDKKNWILTKFNEEINLDKYADIWRNTKKHYKIWLDKWSEDLESCIKFINSDYNARKLKKLSILDFIIDFMIKFRRQLLKIFRFVKCCK